MEGIDEPEVAWLNRMACRESRFSPTGPQPEGRQLTRWKGNKMESAGSQHATLPPAPMLHLYRLTAGAPSTPGPCVFAGNSTRRTCKSSPAQQAREATPPRNRRPLAAAAAPWYARDAALRASSW